MKRGALIALVCIFACSAEPKPAPEDPTDEVHVTYAETVDRLVSRFLHEGQVVSRDDDGSPQHRGDSLLWTGMALGVLPCDRIADVESALGANVEANGGHVVRFMPLPEEYRGGREASLDGELGLLWGVAQYAKRCGTYPAWFATHYAALAANGWVYPGAARLHPEFSYVLDVIAHGAGLRGRPDPRRGVLLGAEVAAWAAATKAAQAAAYRIHLGWLALSAVEAAGEEIGEARAMYCAATDGAGMPLVNEWCGKSGLADWLSTFQFDAYEYALQRGPWESQDGRPGLSTPALDRLVALTQLYNLGGNQ